LAVLPRIEALIRQFKTGRKKINGEQHNPHEGRFQMLADYRTLMVYDEEMNLDSVALFDVFIMPSSGLLMTLLMLQRFTVSSILFSCKG